jgi:anti-sigma factor RsiW
MSIETDEPDLHAFLDGELDELSARRCAVAIAADPALRARADAYRADRDLLRQIYGPLIEEPLPGKLRRLVAGAPARRRPTWQWAVGAGLPAAAAILLGVWLGPGAEPGDSLLAEAIAVRDGAVRAERQMAASMPPAARDALVAETLATEVNVPDLGESGYSLAGFAIYPDRARGQAVQVSYRNGQGRLLTLYLHRPTGADGYEILPERDGKRICIVQTQDLSAVMIGEMSEQDMLKTARLAYHPLRF